MKNIDITEESVAMWLFMSAALIFLRLDGVIDWSWWLVLCPLWGPLVLFVGVIAFLFLAAGLLAMFAAFWEAK